MTDKDLFAPNAFPLMIENCTLTKFENAIKQIGIANACEYFGHDARGDFATEQVKVFQEQLVQRPQDILPNIDEVN